MSGDYLWDRSGPRDPDIVALEGLLGQFGTDVAPPKRSAWRGPAPERLTARGIALMVASVAAVAALVGWVWVSRGDLDVPVAVARLEGAPLVDGQIVTTRQTLRKGGLVSTDAHARARVDVGAVGQLELEPDTRLDLEYARTGDYRVRLQRGTVHAFIRAQPGQFAIETPASTVVDLGCVFTLSVDDVGAARVRVVSGWVGLQGQGREALVPAGAVCPAHPGFGPGTTRFEDASVGLQSALDDIDRGAPPPVVDAAVDRIIEQARGRDAVTLWHVIARVDSRQRDRVFERLAQFVPVPPNVTKAGICEGRQEMLDRWRASLGDDTDAWWEAWKKRRDGHQS